MILSRGRILGCTALLLCSYARDVRAAGVVVAKTEEVNHTQDNSPFFTLSADGTKPMTAAGGWAPIAPTQAAAATTTSTTTKKTFVIPGDSTAAGNWLDGSGVPAGITLTFDAEFTVTALPVGSLLTHPGSAIPTNGERGRGLGVTGVVGGHNDINAGQGLGFSAVTVSNVNFSGTLADPNYSFTPGDVSGFGTILFRSNTFSETDDGMILTQGADTIGFGIETGSIASNLVMDNNFGPPTGTSSFFPRQSGPYTLMASTEGPTIKGLLLGYDVTYDISPNTGTNADFDGDGDVDGADFLTWQENTGTLSGATSEQGDADGNGAVDGADLAAWQGSFGPGAAASSVAAIPEPAAGALAAIGLLLAAVTRKRAV